jgi:hypothetical protein
MPSSDEMIHHLLTSLTAEWEVNQSNVSITRRLASAWEDCFERRRDEESVEGALYYYRHLHELLHEGDSAVAHKVLDLQRQIIGLRIKSIEDWLAQGGAAHAEAPAYRMELQKLQTELAALRSKPVPPGAPAKLFVDLSADRIPPTSSGSASFSAN